MTYSPFDKPIREPLDESDLQKLISDSVTEGYYVEFKSDFPSNIKIARSIASFANTYGGWYIVGVITDNDNIARRIVGISRKLHPEPTKKITEVVKSNTDPVPIFHTRIVSLSSEMSVAVVFVPADQETPFVTRDGRIYRRKADSSDPVFERDRYTVDRLVEAGKKVNEEFKQFCEDRRTFSSEEAEIPWINIFVAPSSSTLTKKFVVPSTTDVEELLARSRIPLPFRVSLQETSSNQTTKSPYTANIEFHVGHITSESIVLRRVGDGPSFVNNSLSLELFRKGQAKILIPIPHSNLGDLPNDAPLTSKTRQQLDRISRHDRSMIRLIHFGQLALYIATVTNFYSEWLGDTGQILSLRIAVQSSNVWNCIAFHDSEAWSDHVDRIGLPLLKYDQLRAFDNRKAPVELGIEMVNQLWFTAVAFAGYTLGIPHDLAQDIMFDAINRVAYRTDGEQD